MKFSLFSAPRLLFSVGLTWWARLRGYQIWATVKTQDDRLEQCNECEELTEERQCGACTCFVDAKTYLNLERCPKRKWGRVWQKQPDKY